ncbi:MAG: glycosyltransferase family 4 protein [Dethiobacteria bacterium]|jgi:glycosyltransferase involved in cell wall biosynthesis
MIGSHTHPKILYLLRPTAGGIKEHLRMLISHFKECYRLVIVCPNEATLVKALQDTGVKVVPFPLEGCFSPRSDCQAIYKIVQLIKKEKVHLLHIHGFKTALLGRIAAHLSGVPAVVTVHNFLADDQLSGLPTRLYNYGEKVLERRTRRYITVSHALATYLVERFQVQRQKITVIHNGIDAAPFRAAARKYRQLKEGDHALPKDIRIGTLARLAPQKGIEYFVRAAGQLLVDYPGIRFYIAGNGPLRQELERLTFRLGLEGNIHFSGFCQDPPSFLAQLDIFLLPSVSEGLSFTLLEAMAAGCPVVATDVGGIPEIIEHGVTGLLVPSRDPTALAQAARHLIVDSALRCKLAANGAERILKRFGQERMLKETDKVYRDILDSSVCF